MIILVDGNNLVWRCHYTHRDLEDSRGNLTGVFFGILSSLHKLATDFEDADGIVMVWDGKRSQKRLELYPEYKGQRGGKPGDKKDPDRDWEMKQVYSQISELREVTLPALGVPQIYEPYTEADDVIWSATKVLRGPVMIVSNDHDFFQLVSTKVKVYNPSMKIHKALKVVGTVVSKDNFPTATKRISPESFLDAKIIGGDASDNIKGIKGVAEGTISAVFKLYPTLDDIWENRVKVAAASRRWASIVNGASAKILIRNYQLMALAHGAIAGEEFCPADVIKQLRAPLTQDLAVVAKSIRIKGSFRLAAKFESWVQRFVTVGKRWDSLREDLVRPLREVMAACSYPSSATTSATSTPSSPTL